MAKRLISHGHEVMNHTHSHACNHPNPKCPGGIAGGGGWNYANELDLSTNLIFTKTGSYPRYFIWPYDVYDQASKDYLKNTLHYYGGRGGDNGETLDASQLNSRDTPDFFNTNFSIHSPTTALSELNGLVDLAITEGKWGMREVHGVNDLSYASIPLSNYKNHCDHIKSKVDAGLLWNANASEVTTYLMQARAFAPVVTYQPQYGRIKISWNNPVLDVSDLRSAVTLNVELDGLTGYTYAYQNTSSLDLVNHGDSVSINCYPHKGEVYLYNYDPATVNNSFSFDQYRTFVRQGEQGVLYSISDHTADEYVWSYSDGGTTVHASGYNATLDFSSGSGNAKVSVLIIKDGKIGLPKSLDVTVLAVNDITYGCPTPVQATFNITNQNNKKYLWLDAPDAGNSLAFASSLTRTNFTQPDTFYIARQDDSILVNVPLTNANKSLAPVTDITARKISIQQSLIFRSVTFGVKQVGPQTVDIYKADGETKVFSTTQSFDVSSLYQLVIIPLNVTLAAGDYYIKFSATAFSNYIQMAPIEAASLMTLYPEGYGIAGDGSINFSDVKSANLTIQIGLAAVKPAVLYPERVAVYMKPLPIPAPVSSTGLLSVCANSTHSYTMPNISGFTNSYYYSDGQFDTTIASASASIHFKDRASNGTLSMSYKNTCGQSSSVLTVAVAVIKPALTNFSSPATIDYPGNAVFNYTKPAGASVDWLLSSGTISFVAQSPTLTELKFSSTLAPTEPSSLFYSVSVGTCSANYETLVHFNRVYPTIKIISPSEGQHFVQGDLIELLASASNTGGESVSLYFNIQYGDNPFAQDAFRIDYPPYQNNRSIDFIGTCTLTVYSMYEQNEQQRIFYVDRATNISSADEYSLTAYPNPTAGKLFVAADWNHGMPLSCTVTNSMGKVYTLEYSNQGGQLEFDFGPLASGLYNLKLSSGDKQYSVNVIKLDEQ